MGRYTERFYTAQDGKRLYYRDYGDRLSPLPPVICLPGLSRNSRDFHDLASHLSSHRRVVCPDYRGRGQSAYDSNPARYHPRALLDDLRHLLVAADLTDFVAIGTSMGGLIAMAFGVVTPSALHGVILNDIGPEIGNAGVDKTFDYIGRDNPQDNWNDATDTVQAMLPSLNLKSRDAWRAIAEGTFREMSDGKLHIDWDPKIIEPLRERTDSAELWRLFRALKSTPVLAFRGELSEILSAETFQDMSAQHSGLTAVTIAGVGHTPTLGEVEALSAIDTFLQDL